MSNNYILFQSPLLLILAGALLISGCSLHSSMINGQSLDIPSSYSTDVNDPARPVGKWWEQFNDDKLNGLMEEAFKRNLDIIKAYERLQQSLATLGITNSSRGINLNIEGSGGRGRQSGSLGPVTSDTYSLSAAASYEIDLWNKLKSKTNAAELDVLASEEDLKAMYISISAQLADLYYQAVEQRAQLDLANKTIETFRDTLNRVEGRYREGLVQAVDVYQSRQNLALAESQRPVFESNLAVTVNAISVLTGNFPHKEAGGSAGDLINAPDFQAGIPSQLLARRPDINAAYLRLKSSDERIAAAISDRFPSFNLIGSYGGAGASTRTFLDSPNIFWNVLLQAAQPVLDGKRRKFEVERTKAVFRENLAGYHQLILNAFREVEDALAQGKSTQERINILGNRVAASEGELRLSTDNYLQGLTDYLPVLTAQQRFYDAKSTLLTAKRQLISKRIQLARALGGEWTEDIVRKNK